MSSAVDPRAVFVVHGRNEDLRKSMFEFLRSIDLAPIEWNQAVALTGEGSPYIGQVLDAAFERASAIVVLMTPDEIAYLQPRYASGAGDVETQAAGQSRPNVLFEAGMALGRDSRRTVLVEIGESRPFSDIAGRHAIRLTNDPKMRQALAERLSTAGCAVKLSGTDWHTAGDFTPPTPPGEGLPLGRRVPSQPSERKAIDFDLRYAKSGGNRLDKLQVINRGTETAYNVNLSMPDDGALEIVGDSAIEKIPGHGKSVSVLVHNSNSTFGGVSVRDAFDITVSGTTDEGNVVSQDVFIDVNG